MRTGELEERRKGFKRCSCPIFGTATIDGKRIRKSTVQWEWDAAKIVAASWENLKSPQSLEPRNEHKSSRVTLREATDAFKSRAINKVIVEATLRKYKTFIKQFIAYCDSRGYVYMDQLTIDDMDRFYAGLSDGPTSKGKKLGMLRSFVKFSLRRKWLTENLAQDLEAPKGSATSANKSPFSDDELDRMYKACDELGDPIAGGPGARPWGGEDVRDFIFLSVFTGLRISDISLFDISKRLDGNDVFLRQHKTKRRLCTWIPGWLVARLREREKRFGPMIFLTGTSRNVRTVTEQWRRRMEKVFKLAGTFEERAYPHRFRATFARVLLENGVGEEDAATLIGDTVEIFRKHYAPWIGTRQQRLTKILQEAFEGKPKKLVSIKGGRA
jgi:site-specific recombinase XerD